MIISFLNYPSYKKMDKILYIRKTTSRGAVMIIKSICDKCKKEVERESWWEDHMEVEYLYECEHWAYGCMVCQSEGLDDER